MFGSCLQASLVDQGMSSDDSQSTIDKVTKLSGDLHHSVMMAKQFLHEVHCTCDKQETPKIAHFTVTG